jgi:hypothetical protein
LGTLSPIFDPKTNLFPQATLLVEVRIAQNFLLSQIFSELETVANYLWERGV